MNPVKYTVELAKTAYFYYEYNGEIQRKLVELCSSRISDKYYRISKGWTNESIHKILL
jgi:hypothetical protein